MSCAMLAMATLSAWRLKVSRLTQRPALAHRVLLTEERFGERLGSRRMPGSPFVTTSLNRVARDRVGHARQCALISASMRLASRRIS